MQFNHFVNKINKIKRDFPFLNQVYVQTENKGRFTDIPVFSAYKGSNVLYLAETEATTIYGPNILVPNCTLSTD